MSVLPDSWAWATFGDIAVVASDLVDPSHWPNAPHVAPNHIESGTGRLRGVTTVADDGVMSPKHRFRAGQVLYSKIRPYLAKATMAPYAGLCSADMYPIDAMIDPKYLLNWILSDDFTAHAAGHQGRSVLPKINQAALQTVPVPVAPLAEQERIAAAIEEALSKLDAGEAGLRTVRQLLRRMREAVLAAGCKGDLTGEWRQSASPISVSQTLRAIESVNSAKGRDATTDVLRGRCALAVGKPPEDTKPVGWEWVALATIARLESGHTPSRRHPEYWDDGLPWLSIKDARDGHGGRVSATLQTVSSAGLANSSARVLPEGTVCLSRTASVGYVVTMARPMATSQDFANWVCTQALNPRFLQLALMAEGEDIKRFGRGTTHTTIYYPELKALHICLPPVEEQEKIVAEVDRQFSFLEVCESAVDVGLARSAALRRSVLKAAFEGRLVPQDPTDEPASVLLERIRAVRAASDEAAGGRRRKKMEAP